MSNANIVPIRQQSDSDRPLPPIPAVPAELAEALGYQGALYLIVGMSLSRLTADRGGEFFLPETGSPDPGGNYFRRLGSWQARGCGSPAKQRSTRDYLAAEGLLSWRRHGLPARNYYRFHISECDNYLLQLGCAPIPTPDTSPKSPKPAPEIAPVDQLAPIPGRTRVSEQHRVELPPAESQLPTDVLAYIDEQCRLPGVRSPGALRADLERRAQRGELYLPEPTNGAELLRAGNPVLDDPLFVAEQDVIHWQRLANLSPSDVNIQRALVSAESSLVALKNQESARD